LPDGESHSTLINLEAWPGVGKLTIGRIRAEKLNGHLLDNHSILAVAIAVTDRWSPQYYATVRAVRTIAFNRILELPRQIPVVLTNVVARGGNSSGSLEENWQAVLELSHRRTCDPYSATLVCSWDENARRMAGQERALKDKLRNPALLVELAATRVVFDDGATYRKSFENTNLAPEECASEILSWITKLH